MAMAADEGGLDSVWGADHLIFREDGETAGIHECWTILTAVAARDAARRDRPAGAGAAVPQSRPCWPRWPPRWTRSATGGWCWALAAAGTSRSSTPSTTRSTTGSAASRRRCRSLVPLLRTGKVSFDGRWHRADAELIPRGPRPNGPPILIAGKQPRMMQLVARHADQWNAAWYGLPEEATELAERIARQRAACEAEGRDPATLQLTAGIFVAFPDLLADGDGEEPPDEAIRGDVEHVGAAMAGYAQHGIEQVIVHLWPRNAAAVSELARAAAAARAAGAPVESAPA